MESPDEKLSRAEACGRAGDHVEVERLCREILAAEEPTAPALCLLAAACQALGKLPEAATALTAAVQLAPLDIRPLDQLGIVLGELGQLAAAVAAFRQELRLQPGAVDAAIHLQITLAAQEFAEGTMLAGQGNVVEAAACFRRATELEPNYADAFNSLGAILADRDQLDEAVADFRRVVELRPDNATAHYNLGLALERSKELAEAVRCYRRALELNPDYVEAHTNLAGDLLQVGQPGEALAAYREVLRLKPDYVDAWYNLAIAHRQRDELDEAIACYRQLLAHRPEHAQALVNLAVALVEQNRVAEAGAAYAAALKVQPDHVDAHIGRAVGLLLEGRLAEAWPEYHWRLQDASVPRDTTGRPCWTGDPLSGRTILLRSEQGFGDTIQFIRYARLVKQQGGTVVVETAAVLAPLLVTCAGIDTVVTSGSQLPAFDVQAHLLSLPGLFRTTLSTIPATVPYLWPAADWVAAWDSQLGGGPGLRVGLAWQGNPMHPRDRARSIPLAAFAPLARLPGVELYSLQFGAGREQLDAVAGEWPIEDLHDRLGDFHNMAAIIANLDLVITCDSAVAHLAGALDKDVWVALALAADWRWMLQRADSPWYPTMRLFRQSQRGDWRGVFERIAAELSQRLDARRQSAEVAGKAAKLA